MNFDPQKRGRRSIRLPGYDYSQAGAYYVTVVSQLRKCFFGEVIHGEMRTNDAGKMIQAVWESMPQRFPTVELGVFIAMPNHFHGIIVIHENVGAGLVPARDDSTTNRATTRVAPTNNSRPTLGKVIGAFKSITTHEYIEGVDELGWEPLMNAYGSETIMNISSAMRMNGIVFICISNPTPPPGMWTRKIPSMRDKAWTISLR